MKARLERHGGKGGNLVIRLMVESEAERVALREFVRPLNGQSFATVPVVVCIPSGPFDPCVLVDDLGPAEVTLGFPDPPAPARKG